jgi:hypothetical protein
LELNPIIARRTLLNDLGIDTGQLDEDDISQCLLSVIRDSYSPNVGGVVEDNVFVVLGITFG